MAEAAPKEEALTVDEADVKEKADSLECAVCLQTCIHPAQLPCGHIFCFLCVKGIANQSKKCAMCRQEIPRDFIEQPNLLHEVRSGDMPEGFDGGYQWFYEGRNGWWQYDLRSNEDIESAFKLNLDTYDLLVCGKLYVIDFQNKVQYPKKIPARKRSIRRDRIENVCAKGVAGLR